MENQLKRTVGLLFVAALTASACGKNDTSSDGKPQGDGDGDDATGGMASSGDGDGDETGDGDGDGTGGRSGDGDGVGGSIGEGGESSLGGADDGGTGGEGTGGEGTGGDGTGGENNQVVSMTPEEACPLSLGSYTNSSIGDVLGGPPVGPYVHFERRGAALSGGPVLVEGTASADRFGFRTLAGTACIVMGDGNDIVEMEDLQIYTGTDGMRATISGGAGADIFAFALRGQSYGGEPGNFFDIVDFTPGEDHVYFELAGLRHGTTKPTNFAFVSSFTVADASSVATMDRTIVVDTTSGNLWLATASNGGAAANFGRISGGTALSEDDFILDTFAPGCYLDFSGPVEDRRGETGQTVPSLLSPSPVNVTTNIFKLLSADGDAIRTSSTAANACIAGMEGDDIIQLVTNGTNLLNALHASGGRGSDQFVFDYPFATTPGGAPPAVSIGDFTPGEDTLVFGQTNFSLTQGLADVTITDFDVTGAAQVGSYKVAIDNTDGEIWYFDGSAQRKIGVLQRAPVVTLGDIVVQADP